MAKAKDRPAPAAKSSGKPAKAAPDTPRIRPPEREMSGGSQPRLSPEEVYRLIQESAYFKAKARNFAPGHEVQDWIEAEQEVRQRLERRA